jgi:hypothetical protein
MPEGALGWLTRVAIATAVLSLIGVFGSTGRAFAATTGELPAAMHFAGLVAAAWLLAGLRFSRRLGGLSLEFEPLSPRRVRVLSTVQRARARRD